ncbi:MAG: HAMP domain-containing histidine kinase [Gammaproteobacteria bacterium]|nr:HAMP domain-containing histidine kinase [Gammaproteobacteria bacterium]
MKLVKPLLQFEQQILATLLLLLHSLIWIIKNPELHTSFTIVLYGLFLLWQPLWNKDTELKIATTLLPALLVLFFSYLYPPEFLFFFSLLLAGLIGSRLFSYTTTRAFDLLALSILTIEMSVGVIPRTFEQISLPAPFATYIQIIVLILILVFFFAPVPDRSHQTRSQIDLMHGMLTTTLVFLVLLGGIVISILYGVDYIDGLLLTVFIVSTLALGISWFWNPGIGYSGIGVLWNRYAMTIGGPFETWINTLTTLIEEPYISSNEFLQAACDDLVENEWLNSIQWQFATFSIQSGRKEGISFQHSLSDNLTVTVFFKSNPGQALRQHTILLTRMAYQFYLSKKNQEKMRADEHFETIHHTGARLTHDIKNILQSIKTSINIVQIKPDENQPLPSKLLQQNLNQISNRLESTLEKLKAPELSTSYQFVDIEKWLENFKSINSQSSVEYHSDIKVSHAIPPELFESVINNLLSNALSKTDTKNIIVDVISNLEMIVVTVCDDGKSMDVDVENKLFNQPVSSGQGMGIGLYQSAFMARAFNYELELANNQEGKVCFSLFQHLGD